MTKIESKTWKTMGNQWDKVPMKEWLRRVTDRSGGISIRKWETRIKDGKFFFFGLLLLFL